MSDRNDRSLERLAVGGDPQAAHRLAASRARASGPLHWLVGQRVLVVTVRIHYLGVLQRVQHIGGDVKWLELDPCRELDSFYEEDDASYGSPQGGGPRYTAPGAPAVVAWPVVSDLSLAPPDWA